jgi:hypothetical protein
MKVARLEQMTKGWFIGDFEPTLMKTRGVEVAVKHYLAGEYESPHLHKIATEFTVIIHGLVEMNGVKYTSGDIVVIEPGECTDFRVLADTVTTVVKIPGAVHDKYSKDGEVLC